MNLPIALPLSGFSGWILLKRTLPAQQLALLKSPAVARDAEYFRKNIAKVRSADDLLADRRLLNISLTAFGLESDLPANAFIKKLLTDGSDERSDLANRLADKRYLTFTETFGLDDAGPAATQSQGFAEELLERYFTQKFEAAVGEQQPAFRLALNAEREVAALARRELSETAKWFTMMGNTPLRQVFETALSLPSGFGRLDLDQQLKVFRSRAKSVLGIESFDQFSEPKQMQKLVTSYLTKQSLGGSGQMSPSQAALQILATPLRRIP